jgi:hypothetical protein
MGARLGTGYRCPAANGDELIRLLGDRTLIIIVVASFGSDRSGTCGANGPTGIQKIEIEDEDDDEGRGRFYVRMSCVKPLGADVGEALGVRRWGRSDVWR